MGRYTYSQAFTLAELLIALAILGVIATFTIPKILTANADSKKSAILKETIATINTVGYQGYLTGELRNGYNGTYMLEHINALKLCPSPASADSGGCFSHTASNGDWERGEPGAVMHNGATLAGFNDSTNASNAVLIDWNGAEGPNTEGEDQLLLEFCFNSSVPGGCPDGRREGVLYPSSTFPDSVTLFERIFSN